MIDDLLARLTNEAVREPVRGAVVDLRPVRNEELRTRVQDLAQRMRAMEHANKEARNIALFRDRPSAETWHEQTSKVIAQSQEQRNRWVSDLRPEAMGLWDELRRRVYGAPPYPREDHGLVALEHGMLAGVSPLTEAATALESLARRLAP